MHTLGQLELPGRLRHVGDPRVDVLLSPDLASAAGAARGDLECEGVLAPAVGAQLAEDPQTVVPVVLGADRDAVADHSLFGLGEGELEADVGAPHPHLSFHFAVTQDGAGRRRRGVGPELGQLRLGAFTDQIGMGLLGHDCPLVGEISGHRIVFLREVVNKAIKKAPRSAELLAK